MTAIVFSLLNALWQGALLVLLVAIIVRYLPRQNAATTCAIWSATYFLVAALPAIDLAFAQPLSKAAQPTAALASPMSQAARGTSAADAAIRESAPDDAVPLAAATTAMVSTSTREPARTAPWLDFCRVVNVLNAAVARVTIPVLALWIVTAVVLLWRLGWSYAIALGLKRDAQWFAPSHDFIDVSDARRAVIGISPRVRVPCAVGFLHPMIVLPSGLAEALEPADLTRVIVHEHAHLRRYDDYMNAVQRLVAVIFFFHPVLHYVAQRIELDREVACDDAVVEAVGEPLEYARCLTKIVDRHVRGRRLAVVPGFFFGRSQVIARVNRLIDGRRSSAPGVARYGAVVAVSVALVALALARLQVPVIAAEAPASASSAGQQPLVQDAPARARQSVTVHRHVNADFNVTPDRGTLRTKVRGSARMPTGSILILRGTDPTRSDVRVRVRVSGAGDAAAKTIEKTVRDVHAHVRTFVRIDEDGTARVTVLPPGKAFPPLRHVSPLPPLPRVAALPPLPRVAPLPPLARVAPGSDHVVVALPHSVDTAADIAAIPQQARAATTQSLRAFVTDNADTVQLRAAGDQPRSHVDLLDALAKNGYPHLSVDELVGLANHGVTGSYVSAITPLLPARPTVEQLVALADHGISANYVRAMAAAGYPHLTSDQLVVLRDAGVTPLFVKRLSDHGYRNLTVDQLLKLSESGV